MVGGSILSLESLSNPMEVISAVYIDGFYPIRLTDCDPWLFPEKNRQVLEDRNKVGNARCRYLASQRCSWQKPLPR